MKKLFRPLSIAIGLALAVTPSLAQKVSPKILTTVSPGYPEELINTGMDGRAEVDVLIKADGTVGETQLAMASHRAMGKAAMKAVTGWTFQPATVDGHPVDLLVALPFIFEAPFEQKVNAASKRVVFQAISETALTEKEFPHRKLKVKEAAKGQIPPALARSEINEEVKVKCIIGPDGFPLNPTVVESKKKELDKPAILAVARSSYEPPLKDGKPVYVETVVSVAFNNQRRGDFGGGGGGGGGGGDFGGGGGGGGGDGG